MARSGRYNAYIDGPWGQIHIRVAGGGHETTVLLLHKMPWSSLVFKNAQPFLAARSIRSIAVDMPGYGLSDKPESCPRVQDYAAGLLPVLDRFGLERVNLLGDHTGAAFAAAFCDLYPNRADRLILDGPPVFDAETRKKFLAAPHYDGALSPDGTHFVRRLQSVRSSLPGAISPEALHDAVTQFFLAGPKEHYGHDAIFQYDLTAVLRRLTGPVMIMTNPGDTLYRLSKDVMTMRPDFAFHEGDWPGSQNPYDNPGPWSDAVADFLLNGGLR